MQLRLSRLGLLIATLLAAVPVDGARAGDSLGNSIIVGRFGTGSTAISPQDALEQLRTRLSTASNGMEFTFSYLERQPLATMRDAREQWLQSFPLAVMWQTRVQVSPKRLVTHNSILIGSSRAAGDTFILVPGVIALMGDTETNLALYEVVLRYAFLIRARAAQQPTRAITRELGVALRRAEGLGLTQSSPCLREIRRRFDGGTPSASAATFNC